MGELVLFRWDKSTPAHAFIHGSTNGLGTLGGSLDVHRGVDLRGSFDVVAEFEGHRSAGSFAATAVAQLEGHLAVEVAAILPLDLFGGLGAGAVARVRVELALTGAAGLTVSYGGGDLLGDLIEQLPPVLHGVAKVIVEEISFSAGVWAKGTLAAAAKAQAVIVGSLVPLGSELDSQPGFTVSIEGHASFGFGGGFQLIVNAGIPDPDRMLARIADQLAVQTLALIDRWLDARPPSAEVRAARATIGILIPISLHLAMQLGHALVRAGGNARDEALRSAVGSIATQGRDALLRAVMAVASNELRGLIGDIFTAEHAVEQLLSSPELSAPIVDFALALTDLNAVDLTHVEKVLPLVEKLLGAADAVVALQILPLGATPPIRDVLADMWCAAALLHQVWTTVAGGGSTHPDLFSGAAPAPPAGVRAVLGDTPSLGTLVARLLDRCDADRLVRSLPEVSGVLDWLGAVLGVDSHAVLHVLLVDLVPPTGNLAPLLDRLAAHAGASAASAATNLLDPIRHDPATDPLVVEFLDNFAIPMLAAVPDVLIPAIAHLQDDEAVARSREALSIILVHCLQRFLLGAAAGMATAAGEQISELAGRAADDVAASGDKSPSYAPLAQVSTLLVSPADVEDLLRLVQECAPPTAGWFAESQKVLSDAVDVGLVTAAGRSSAVAKVLTTDDPLDPAALNRSIDACERHASALLELIGSKSGRLLSHWLDRRIEALGEDLEQAAALTVATIRHVLDDVQQEIHQLDEYIRELERRIGEAIVAIADEVETLTSQLSVIAHDVLEQARAMAHALARDVIPAGDLRATVDHLIDTEFDAADDIQRTVLDALHDAAVVVKAVLTAATQTGEVTRAGVDRSVQTSLLGALPDLVISISLFGIVPVRITVQSETLALMAGQLLTGSPQYVTAVDASLATARDAARDRQSRTNAQAQRMVADHQQRSHAYLDQMSPHAEVSAELDCPVAAPPTSGAVPLRVRLHGVNRSFVDPWVGMAPRVLVRVGNRAVPIPWSDWHTTGEGELTCCLILRPRRTRVADLPQSVPQPLRPGRPPSEGLVPPALLHSISADGAATVFAGSAPAALERRAIPPAAGSLAHHSLQPGQPEASTATVRVRLHSVSRRAVVRGLRGEGPIHGEGDDDPGYGDVPSDPGTNTGPPAGTPGGHGPESPTTVPWWQPEPPPLDPHPSATWLTVDVNPGAVPVEVAVVTGDGPRATVAALLPVRLPNPALVEAVRRTAWALYARRDRSSGRAEDDWYAAETVVLAERIRTRALYAAIERHRAGEPGDPTTDWLRAEQVERLALMGG